MSSMTRQGAELRMWRFGGAVLAGCVLLGLGQGALWAAIAPGELYQVGKDGGYGQLPTESTHRFASIAIFCLLSLAVGVWVAVATWAVRSARGTIAVVIIGFSTAVGSLTAYLLGRTMVSGVDPSTVGAGPAARLVFAPAVLGNAMVLVIAPAAAVVIYTLLAMWNGHPDLGRPLPISPVSPAAPVDAAPRTDR